MEGPHSEATPDQVAAQPHTLLVLPSHKGHPGERENREATPKPLATIAAAWQPSDVGCLD